MSFSSQWWIICGLLVAVELATGTFYLLMLALGAAAGAVAAMLGLGPTAQFLSAAVVGGGAVILWHTKRARAGAKTPPGANPDVSLDIGQQVQVKHWHADGSATVRYRGADWSARFAGDGTPAAGRFKIRAIEGSCLQLDN